MTKVGQTFHPSSVLHMASNFLGQTVSRSPATDLVVVQLSSEKIKKAEPRAEMFVPLFVHFGWLFPFATPFFLQNRTVFRHARRFFQVSYDSVGGVI